MTKPTMSCRREQSKECRVPSKQIGCVFCVKYEDTRYAAIYKENEGMQKKNISPGILICITPTYIFLNSTIVTKWLEGIIQYNNYILNNDYNKIRILTFITHFYLKPLINEYWRIEILSK